jgi:two-component system, NarL family, sensor kinase
MALLNRNKQTVTAPRPGGSKAGTTRKVSYVFSIGVAAVLLLVGCAVYGRTMWPSVTRGARWMRAFPLLAMSYGSLVLLGIAILESRVRHARQGDLLLKKDVLGQAVDQVARKQEHEREAVSEVLHDDVAPLITTAKMDLESLARRHSIPREEWEAVDGLLQEALKELRGVASVLYPRTVLRIGLCAALTETVERFRAKDNAPVVVLELDESGLRDIDGDVALCVLRVVQECLLNVSRHANASRVQVHVRQDASGLLGFVEDNGQGFADTSPGMGLTIVEQRLNRLGGDVGLDTSELGGAKVSFRLAKHPQDASLSAE